MEYDIGRAVHILHILILEVNWGLRVESGS